MGGTRILWVVGSLIWTAGPAQAKSGGLEGPVGPVPAVMDAAGVVVGDLSRASSPVQGTLAPGDRTLPSGEYVDALPFTGRRGQHLVVRMVSTEFDAYLIVRAPSGRQFDDDDGGKGTHARLELDLTEDGVHEVLLTSKRPGEAGSYRLHVRSDGGRMGVITGAGPRLMPAPGVQSLVGGESGPSLQAGLRPVRQGLISIQPGVGVVLLQPGVQPAPVEPGPPVAPEGPPVGEPIGSGETIDGSLGPGDRSLGGGQWADWYAFDVQQGQPVVVDLSSRQVDAFLAVVPPGGEPLTNDDRTQGNTDAFLSFTAPATGSYLVAASSYQRGERGDYRLRVVVGDASPGGLTPGPVTPGQPLAGALVAGDDRLASGEFIDWVPLQLQPGLVLTVDLAATEFDPYLVVVTPSGGRFENDDAEDGSGTRNSRIQRRLEEGGTYQIGVTSYQPGETGRYELRVATEEAAAPAPAPQGGTALTAGRSIGGEFAPGDPTLAGGEYVDTYTFEGRAGQAARIDMASTAVDPYLILQFPDGRRLDNDDVGPNDRNASVFVELPLGGTYRVLCTTYRPAEAGAYDVALSLDAEPLVPGPGPSPTGIPDQNRGFFGVFVGISDYPGGVNDLPLCREDAEKLAQTFKSIGLMDDAHIDLISDSRATVANVRGAMQRMSRRVGPDDVFVFFYSGHGGQSDTDPQRYPDEVDGRQETIVLTDGEYTDDQVRQDLDAIDAGLTVVALDSCFAGGFARDVVSQPGRVGFFSSEEDLTSNVAGEFQAGGYLSHFFQKAVEGYADLNRDGLVQIGELSHYLQTQYAEHVREASSESVEGAAGYQHLVVDRGAVRVDTLFFRAGRAAGGAAAPRLVDVGF
ncbi:MAG: caspase family protein [Deltaproteobacteria bacterium]|nr:caspase family protein [Deltaproteobacteria bacterium]